MRKITANIFFSIFMLTACAHSAWAATLPEPQKTQTSVVNVCATPTAAQIKAAGFDDRFTIVGSFEVNGPDKIADNFGRVCPKLKNSSGALVDAYFATRYQKYVSNGPDGRPRSFGNPMGSIKITLPAGFDYRPFYVANTSRVPSQIGSGWGLLNTGAGTPRPEGGYGENCPSETNPDPDPNNWSMYKQTFELNGIRSCVPWGYAGSALTVWTGPKCTMVFAFRSGIGIVDDGIVGTVTGAGTPVERATGKKCGNILTINFPALFGLGSYPGEFFLGHFLTDFRFILQAGAGMKSGPSSCKNKKAETSSQVSYSPRKWEDGKGNDGLPNDEDFRPAPQPVTNKTISSC